MGKKSRARAGNTEPKTATVTKSKSGKNNLWLIMGGAAIMIVLVWVTFKMTNKESSDSPLKDASTVAKFDETVKGPLKLIATLSPEQFTGKSHAAYQAAKEIPEILAQLPCFCGCLESKELGHKNNLYCFADTHGNICDLCQTIALEAKEMNRKGIPVEKIRSNIRATYGSSGG